MNFESALKALIDDKNVKRKTWWNIDYMCLDRFGVGVLAIYVNDKFIPYTISFDDVIAEDWEVLERES